MVSVNMPAMPEPIIESVRATGTAVESTAVAQEGSLLRWAGVAGIIGAVVFLVSIVYQVAFIGTNSTAAGSGPVMRFPGLQTQIIVGQTLFLVGVLLFVPLFVALARTLRSSSLPGALFGGLLSFLGLAVLAVESEPNVAMAQISSQYHAAGATAAQQATAVQLWQATQGMFNQFDTCAYIFLSVGFLVLGVAMMRNPSFGRGFGGVSAALGVAGLIALASFPVDSGSFAPFALLTFAVFPLLFGWKLYSSSRIGRPAVEATTAA